MEPFTKHNGLALPLFQSNIDTDQIVPKKFLLWIERTGFEEALFYDWRHNTDGSINTDFVLNDSRYAGSSILLTGKNFGCGSSREHAPWALFQYGFRVIIAASFGDIFYSNALKTGLLPVALSEEKVAGLVKNAMEIKDYKLFVDLENQLVTDEYNFNSPFEIEEFRRYCLLNGLDDIGLTLQYESKISQYEEARGLSPICM